MKIKNIFSSFLFTLQWIWKVDFVYCWFAGYHGFFPILFAKILGKKSIVIVGGYDASYVPSIRYGVFYNKGPLLWVIKKVYQWATYICPVDESLVESINYYADPTGKGYKTGLLHHIKIGRDKIVVIPTGYDAEKYTSNKLEHRNTVLSIGIVNDDQTFSRKGFDLIFELAYLVPNIRFVLAGISNDYKLELEKFKPPNVLLLGELNQNEIIKLYSQAKIFLQLSLCEGLPNTLCEAMLCECIPIGSKVNGIPKAIGDTGYVLKEKNVETLRSYIKDAFSLDENHRLKARLRISEMFPLKRRIETLKEIIEN